MYAPEDKDKALVSTPYGKGLVLRTRTDPETNHPTMREIELLDWPKPESNRGLKRPSMLYSSSSFPSVPPIVGSEVTTVFGRGKVTEIRHDGMAVVRITSWRLAGRSEVTCYLTINSIQVVKPKRLFEMSVFEKIEFAQKLKDEATAKFSAKEYSAALQLYAEAVDAVRYVQHNKDSTNELRADLLVVMITCCNNAATCCVKLNEWSRAQKFAKNALVLLEALYERKGDSKILKLLKKEGFDDAKLFGCWRVKSHLVVARGLAELHETAEAINNLKMAQDAINEYKKDGDPVSRQLQSQEKEVRKLLIRCKDIKKADSKKERQRAKAMFRSSEEKKDSGKDSEPGNGKNERKMFTDVEEKQGLHDATKASNGSVKEHVRPSSSKAPAKKRVSFADGTTPGSVDDSSEPSFWGEHKEALMLIGGIAFGSLCIHVLLGNRRK